MSCTAFLSTWCIFFSFFLKAHVIPTRFVQSIASHEAIWFRFVTVQTGCLRACRSRPNKGFSRLASLHCLSGHYVLPRWTACMAMSCTACLATWCDSLSGTCNTNTFVQSIASHEATWSRLSHTADGVLAGLQESAEQRVQAWSFGLVSDGDGEWSRHYAQLQEYVTAHGDAHVGFRSVDDAELSRWAGKQRRDYKTKSLSAER